MLFTAAYRLKRKLEEFIKQRFGLMETLLNPKKKDDLTKTVDYETVTSIILEEMKQSSDLIEHVARRILNKTFSTFSNIKKLKVKIVKIKPPVSADIPQVEYILKKKR